jgi:hypothetical protein
LAFFVFLHCYRYWLWKSFCLNFRFLCILREYLLQASFKLHLLLIMILQTCLSCLSFHQFHHMHLWCDRQSKEVPLTTHSWISLWEHRLMKCFLFFYWEAVGVPSENL